MQSYDESIQRTLLSMQDTAYRDFIAKLLPTIDKKVIIGVRTGVLRKYAQTLYKTELQHAVTFMQKLPHRYVEENNLHVFLIANMKDFTAAMAETERFLPFIDNWATCDSFKPSIFKKYPDEVYQHILHWIHRPHTYTIRYAIGLLLSNYLDTYFKPEMLEFVASIHSQEYYINMMVAWYFSTALIKQYDAAIPYIEKKRLQPFTHSKTIQKAIESVQIPVEIKEKLRGLRN